MHRTPPEWSRRSFLAAVAASVPLMSRRAGAAALDADVLVVGAGAAGLAAAETLRRQGHSVGLLEAGRRTGGRVRTIRAGLAEGLRAEAGAERIAPGHRRVHRLLAQHGLTTTAYTESEAPFSFAWGTTTQRVHSLDELDPTFFAGLTPFEREAAPFDIALSYALDHDPPPHDDPRSALAWLRDLGMTEAAERMALSYGHLPLASMSAAWFYELVLREPDTWNAETITGGSDRLTDAMAAPLAPITHRAQAVECVAQSDDHVTVVTADDAVFRAKHVLLCVPLASLRRIRFEPHLPAALRQALDARAVVGEVKVHWELPVAALEEGHIAPAAVLPRFPRSTWLSPETEDGHRIMNAIAVQPDACESVAKAQDSTDALRKLLQEHAPALTRASRSVCSVDFTRDPYFGGAYTMLRPGQAPRPASWTDGRVTCAGADLSDQPGWLEGALASAEQAVPDVVASLGRGR